jgi:hypothetical protein
VGEILWIKIFPRQKTTAGKKKRRGNGRSIVWLRLVDSHLQKVFSSIRFVTLQFKGSSSDDILKNEWINSAVA